MANFILENVLERNVSSYYIDIEDSVLAEYCENPSNPTSKEMERIIGDGLVEWGGIRSQEEIDADYSEIIIR